MGVLAWARRSVDNAVQALGGFQITDLLPQRNFPRRDAGPDGPGAPLCRRHGRRPRHHGQPQRLRGGDGLGRDRAAPGHQAPDPGRPRQYRRGDHQRRRARPAALGRCGGARLSAGQVAAGRFYEIVLDPVAPAWRVQAGASTLDEIPGLIGLRTEVATNATDARSAAASTAADRAATAADRAHRRHSGPGSPSPPAPRPRRRATWRPGPGTRPRPPAPGAETAQTAAQTASGTATALVAEVVANQAPGSTSRP